MGVAAFLASTKLVTGLPAASILGSSSRGIRPTPVRRACPG